VISLIKPVSFNEIKDCDILNYLDDLDISFTSYVKKLIREDMQKNKENSEVSELVAVLKDMINRGMIGQVQQAHFQAPPPQSGESKQDDLSEGQRKALTGALSKFIK
jgi:hypothetical protein